MLLFTLFLVALSKAIGKVDFLLFSLLDHFHLLGHEMEIEDHFFDARFVRVLLVSKVNKDFFGYRVWKFDYVIPITFLFTIMGVIFVAFLAQLGFIFDWVKRINCLCHVCVFSGFFLLFVSEALAEIGAQRSFFFDFLFDFKLQNCAADLDVCFLAWDNFHWLLKDFKCTIL